MLVQRRAGGNLVSYLMPRLFRPLGIQRPTWETDPLGYTFGADGLFLTLLELHKLGLLYLQKGMWGGKQVVPAEWVEESLKEEYGYGNLSLKREDAKELAPLGIIMKKLFSKQ